ncbi:hypothetical protein ACFL4K_00185 [Candidatus Neomarinimicrobiota bacterium]
MVAGFPRIRVQLAFLLFTIAVNSPIEGQNGSDDIAIKSTIASETIQHAGLTRVTDLLLLIDDWRLSSIDDFTWTVNPNGLTHFQEQNWLVLIDGQKMSNQIFDIMHLNTLPLSLSQIDSVEIFSVPTIHEGEFADKGLIHIHTKKSQKGVSFSGSTTVGQITGDPGPYYYTKYITPNVDRIGPSGAIGVGFRREPWTARSQIVINNHAFTHSAIGKRNYDIISDWPGIWNVIPSLKISWDWQGYRHELLTSHSHSKKHFIFFPPFGREIPTYSRFTHVGLRGAFPFGNSRSVKYNLGYSQDRLDEYPNSLNIDFNWAMIKYHGNIEWIHDGERLASQVGMGLERHLLDTRYQINRNHYDLAKLYGLLRFGSLSSLEHCIGGYVTLIEGETALKGLASSMWRISSSQVVRISISYSQRLLPENDHLLYWTRKGYNMLHTYGADYDVQGDIENSGQLTADLDWQAIISKSLIIRTQIALRKFENLLLQKQTFQFDLEGCSIYSPTTFIGENYGETALASIRLTHHPNRIISQQIYYGFSHTLSGNTFFKDQWLTIPKHKLSYQLTINPEPNLSIWAMFSYRSSSNWLDYAGVDGAVCPTDYHSTASYISTLNAYTSVDLQIQKWFLHHRIKGNLLFRNLFNREIKLHPLGASFDFSFFIQVYLYLNPKDE